MTMVVHTMIAATVGVLVCGSAWAQQRDRSGEGQPLVATVCAACHRISPDARDGGRHPPDLGAIAEIPSLTELSLRVFLQTPHGQMPRYQFSSDELDEIIKYVMSLKRR